MFDELVKSVLVAAVAFALKTALAAIGVQIDEVLFNTLAAGIVTYLLTLLGYEGLRKLKPAAFRSRNEG